MSEEYQQGKLNGTTKTYYYEGSLYEVKSWNKDVLDGDWKQFFMDGTLKMQSAYSQGKRDGKQIYYHPNGKVYYNGKYTDDLKVGNWEYFNEEGVMDTIINYNE